MARGLFERTPSLLASAVIHGAVGLAIFLFWPKTPPPQFEFGQGVPINIVAAASAPRAAEQADVVQQAATEVPVPTLEPMPPTPTPAPVPVPVPKSFITPTKPASASSRVAPGRTKPAEDNFLDNAAAALSKGGGAHSNAQQGHNQRETDRQPRQGTASDLSQGELTDLAGPLFKVWGANCFALGGNLADVTISVTIGANGHFKSAPHLLRKDGSPAPEDDQGNCLNCDALTSAASARAKAALRKVEPYHVPPRFPDGVTMSFHFDPRKFC
jgi:hypothetical protein